MAEKGRWVRQITNGSQLYGESLPGVPILEMAGDRRVLVEQHNGVIEYGTEQIRIRMKYGVVTIGGCGLQLKQMTKEQLIVTGQIDCIRIQRRCR